jgi:hypothetical protein
LTRFGIFDKVTILVYARMKWVDGWIQYYLVLLINENMLE